jgi:hypothetical protein
MRIGGGAAEYTHVRKKVEARGKFCANSVGAELGFFKRPGRAAMRPDARETIRKECCTSREVAQS